MFLFIKLVLAHYIADFILQFEELYRLKLKSKAGHIWHVVMHGLASLILAGPYLRFPSIWIFVLAITVIHYIQDRIKYSYQAQHPKTAFFCFTVDQIFHLGFIACVLLLPESHLELGFGIPALDVLYKDNRITLILIAFIISVFKGAYFLHAFRKTFIPGSRPDHFITSREMAFAFWQRGLVTGTFLLASPKFFFLVLLADLRPQNRLDFILNFLFAAATGLLIRMFL